MIDWVPVAAGLRIERNWRFNSSREEACAAPFRLSSSC